MKKGTLFIAPLGARDKKAAIFKEIVSLCPEGDYSSVLYLGPNGFVLREATSEFFSYLKKANKKSAYVPFQSLTIKRLATNLHEAYGQEEIISDHVRTLILCEILGEKNIGYANQLSNLFKKIRHYVLDKGISQLKEEIKNQIFEEKVMKTAVKAIEVLEIYEDELNKKGLIDSERMVEKSIPLIKAHANPEVLVIDGFFDPTPLELKVIKSLIDKADTVYMLIEESSEFFKYFQSYKQDMSTKRLKSITHRESTGYYSYPSMEEEVEGIARKVKALILEGTKPWEIVVTFPVLSKYLSMLKRVFQKHGIPISIEEYELSNTRPFTAIDDMITCIENDYPRNEFLSFLTSAHFPEITGIVKEWAVAYSYRAGVVKGKQSWLSIKETLLNSLGEEVSGIDKPRLDKFQKGMRQIINVLEDIKQKNTLLSFIDAVEHALEKFGFFDSLPGGPYGEDISDKIANQISEFRRFARLYRPGPYNFETSGFYLRHLLKDLKSSDKQTEGVRVVPFELAAPLEVKAIFFGGLIEEDFPSKPVIDPILPEKVKKALGMPYLESYLNRQKRYFKRLLDVSLFEPYFSCPSAEGDKLFLPSPFLDWEKSLSPLPLNIFSEEDILVRDGLVKQVSSSAKIFWDGELRHDRKTRSILQQRLGTMSKGFISVTDLDYYRRCPMRFYIEKVLGLDIEEPPRFEVEARLWGSLAHKTMEYMLKDGEIEIDDMEKKLFKCLDICLKKFPIGNFWAKVAREIFQRLLPELKEQEKDIRMQGFIPYMVEKTIKAEIDSLRLRGKIDRIDIKKFQIPNSKFQKDKKSKKVILLDYKTGTIDRDSLQLPLYAGMWQGEYAEPVERTGFYSLKEGCISWYPKRMSMEEFIQDAVKAAKELIKEMKKGMFLPVPFKDEECRFCYHSPLCKTTHYF